MKFVEGRYSSGQRGQTVNLLTYVFTGSNPVLPTVPTEALAKVGELRSTSERGQILLREGYGGQAGVAQLVER